MYEVHSARQERAARVSEVPVVLCAGGGDFHDVAQRLVEVKNIGLFLDGSMAASSEDLQRCAWKIVQIPGATAQGTV